MRNFRLVTIYNIGVSLIAMTVTLANTLGVLEIGSFLGVFLFGVVSLQTFNYYNMYPEDSWVFKTLVATVWVCEIAHTIGTNYEVYRMSVIQFGKPDLQLRLSVIGVVSVFGTIITLLVQIFFALRLTKLLPRPYNKIGVVCIAISTVRSAGAAYLSVAGITATSLASYRHEVSWLVSTTFSVSAAVDVAIASSMLYYLIRQRGKEMRRMSKLLDRLITYTVRSGLLTSISAISLVVCFQTMPDNLVWIAVYTFLAKLYSNSLLSALNARKTLRNDVLLNPPTLDEFILPTMFRDSETSPQDDNSSQNKTTNVTRYKLSAIPEYISGETGSRAAGTLETLSYGRAV